MSTAVSTSVITLVSDRAVHLARLGAGLARSRRRPGELVVVDMGSQDDPRDLLVRAAPGLTVRWVDGTSTSTVSGQLPLAAARNAGAAAATAERLIFLDVDCIPSAAAVEAYADAIDRGGLVCGPVRWLERSWDHALAPAGVEPACAPSLDAVLTARSSPHPARPCPPIEMCDARHELFWSLAFGTTRTQFEQLGGFHEGYVGYGAEDTDLGFVARHLGVPLRWIPDGTVFHQWHPVSDPPVEHLEAIVANAERFRRRWGRWPMEGWLSRFAADDLIRWDPTGAAIEVVAAPGAEAPLRIASIPASHPYTRKVHHDQVEVRPDPTDPWWPHPAFEPGWAAGPGSEVDLVHVHFGFEHRTSAQLRTWCDELAAAGLPLLVTVHDLENPHETSGQREHHQRLSVLLDAASAVVTLTESAAGTIEDRFGCAATVIPHPHVAPLDPNGAEREPGNPRIGLHFKAFRANTLEPGELLGPLGRAADETGSTLVVRADDHGDPERLARLVAHARKLGLAVTVAPHLDDAELLRFVAGLDVLVLPYRFGTHSGMIELCRDLGTRPIVAATGCYAEQWSEAMAFDLDDAGAVAPETLRATAVAAVRAGPLAPATHGWRREQLRAVRDSHLAIGRHIVATTRTARVKAGAP